MGSRKKLAQLYTTSLIHILEVNFRRDTIYRGLFSTCENLKIELLKSTHNFGSTSSIFNQVVTNSLTVFSFSDFPRCLAAVPRISKPPKSWASFLLLYMDWALSGISEKFQK